MERVRLKRLAVAPPRRRKLFRYIPRDEQARLREARKRKRLGGKHDDPIPADRLFTLALRGLGRSRASVSAWEANMEKALDHMVQQYLASLPEDEFESLLRRRQRALSRRNIGNEGGESA